MTSHEPDDDASTRRRDGPGHPTSEQPGAGHHRPRVIGPPADPYRPDGEDSGARDSGGRDSGARDSGGEGPDDAVLEGHVVDGRPGIEAPVVLDGPVVVGEPYRPVNPPRTQQQRNEDKRQQTEAEAPPKPDPETVGRYPFEAPPITQPPDPIRMFLGSPKPRRRRSDWPVLVLALVVAAVVTAACCLSGFALFSTWNPFGP
jgi:hypothetical protein